MVARIAADHDRRSGVELTRVRLLLTTGLFEQFRSSELVGRSARCVCREIAGLAGHLLGEVSHDQ